MKPPPVQFADSPEGKIAYQIVGDGPIDLIVWPGPRWHLDLIWEQPAVERYIRRLALFARVILCNVRGSGLSDPLPFGSPPTPEEWASDLRWALDAAGSERAAVLAMEGTSWAALLFAASFPERTRALALVDGYATLRRDEGYPWGFPPEPLKHFFALLAAQWGSGEVLRVTAPELADDERFRHWYARLERSSLSPTVMTLAVAIGSELDLRGILPTIKAPTLVISHTGNPYLRLGHGRYLAENIPNARYVERPGFWGVPWLHDVDATIAEVESFLTGTRGSVDLDDRVLATVLFTDIVGSTERAAELGDRRWREVLDDHDALARREIERFRGRALKSTGDGVMATFDGPARAIRCAIAIKEAVGSLGLKIRAGLHTGEVEQRGEDVGGIAVHIAARVMAQAGPGQVLVSGSVPPLVAGSGIEFDERGPHELKGVPGEWRLFAVRS